MQSFKWDQYFETGLEEVDEQHQSLVNIVNRYSSLLAENHVSLDEIRLALFELSRYSEYHFKEEEKLMREVGISALHLEEHIQVHRTFMSEVFSMQAFIHDVDDARPFSYWSFDPLVGVPHLRYRSEYGATSDCDSLRHECRRGLR